MLVPAISLDPRFHLGNLQRMLDEKSHRVSVVRRKQNRTCASLSDVHLTQRALDCAAGSGAGVTVVSAHGARVLVRGDVHDVAFVRARFEGAGDKAGAKTVPR